MSRIGYLGGFVAIVLFVVFQISLKDVSVFSFSEVVPLRTADFDDIDEKPPQEIGEIEIENISNLKDCPHWSLNLTRQLKKTMYSDSFRVLFIQGIEGTGHHMFETFRRHAHNDLHQKYFTVSHGHDKFWRMYVPEAPKTKQGVLNKGYEAVTILNKAKINLNATVEFPATHLINELLSYPAFWGKCKITRYPDVRLFAKILENAGMDFRIVTLLRDPVKTISSNVRRGFHHEFVDYKKGAMRHYLAILKDMVLQTEQLDPKFYHCFDFDSHATPDSLSDFINFKGDLQKGFDDIKIAGKEKVVSSDDSDRKAKWAKFVNSPLEKADFEEYVKVWNRLKQRCKDNEAITGYGL